MRHPTRILLAVAVVTVGVGCGEEQTGDAERFCGEVQANTQAIVDPRLESAADIEALLMLYRDLGEVVPLAIEGHWDALILNYETASSVEPGNAESTQRVLRQAYATERSAVAVRDWLRENCAVDIGPVATVLPPPISTAPGGSTPPTTD